MVAALRGQEQRRGVRSDVVHVRTGHTRAAQYNEQWQYAVARRGHLNVNEDQSDLFGPAL